MNGNTARRILIRIGKSLPFLFAFLVFVNYTENVYAITLGKYADFGGNLVYDTPLSYAIASYIEYDCALVILAGIISLAIEACIWNLLCGVYLLFNLLEKSFFLTHDFSPEVYLYVSVVNMLIAGFLCFQGGKILFRR